MSSSAEQMRKWQGPAILSYGFRPFFFLGAVWAALAMLLWVLMLAGVLTLPTAFDPVSWHAHALLFGYLPAIVAGFLLTAVPNWTGRLPVVGWPLGGLVLLWLAGRLAVAVSAGLPATLVALIDLSAPTALAAMMAREIIAGKNWRNLIVLAMMGVLIVANVLFHIEAATGGYPAQGYGLRLGLGSGLMMIGVIGGRIVPSFTRNWLAKQGSTSLPVPPMQRFDKAALLVLLAALLSWVALPEHPLSGVAMLAAGLMHLARLSRWSGGQTLKNPLLAVLHIAYFLMPLGALTLGIAILLPDLVDPTAAQHIWMAGAIGLMTLAVMSRATLGHTGQPLAAGAATTAIYAAVLISVLSRFVAGLLPEAATTFYYLSAIGWMIGFGGFALRYGPLLLLKRPG